jgi:sphinganine C4-monooxygenase
MNGTSYSPLASSSSSSFAWSSSIFPAVNDSLLSLLSPPAPLPSSSYPFYHSAKPSLIPGVSDRYTALAVPIVAYWFLGSLFYWLDEMQFEYFEKRRLHESEEVTRRNRVTLVQVSPSNSCPYSLRCLVLI